MRALALVESPFHLICLNEAISEMAITELDVFVVTSHQSRNFTQLQTVKSYFPKLISSMVTWHYGNTDEATGPDLNARIGVYALPFKKFRDRAYGRLILSDFRSQWQKDIASAMSGTDTWMLDDGTATLSFLYFHLPAGKQFSLPVYGSAVRREEAARIKVSYGLGPEVPGNISLFTIFGTHVPENTQFMTNHLRALRKEFKEVDESTAVIIGSKVVERDFCDVQEYQQFIDSILKRCPENVIYIPHRGQTQSFNEELLAAFPALKIEYIDLPLELWLREQDRPPASLHGFVSTAFYVASSAFQQIKLYCYAPTENMLKRADELGVYGSDCFTNSEAVRINYTCLPETVRQVV